MGHNAPITRDSHAEQDRELERRQDGELVARALAGDDRAFGLLYDAWADRVFNLALRIVRDHDTAAEVGQDAFLAAWSSLAKLEDQASFGGWLLRITRNRALDRLKASGRAQATDAEGMAMIERGGASPSSAPRGFDLESGLGRAEDPEVAAGDGEVVALVHQTIAALGERDAEVLDLQLRYHLSPAEVGEVIGINRNAANQLCHRVRARFASAFGVRMLWNGRRPACRELQSLLVSAGIDGFGADALPLASGHADTCPECGDRRRSRLDPTALFAAVPLIPMAGVLRAAMVEGLAGSGVPMGGSTVSASGSGAGGLGSAGDPSRGTDGGQTAGQSDASPGEGSSSPDPASGSGADSRHLDRSFSSGPAGGRRPVAASRRLAAVGFAGLVILMALLVANAGVTRSAELEQAVSVGTTDSSIAIVPPTGSSPTAPPATDTGTPTSGPTDTGSPDPTAVPATQAPPTAPPSTAPTTTVPPASIDQFELAPSTPQPYAYRVGRTSPVLTWSVTGATQVTVTSYYDDGVIGPRVNRVESTEASGRLDVCPGPVNADSTCLAPSGRYTYVIEATNAAGVAVTSDRANPPGFDIQPQPVID